MRLRPDYSRDGLGVCCFGGSSSTPSGTTTNTATSAPWAGQQPALNQEIAGATALYNGGAGSPLAPNYYGGQVQAQQNALQTGAGTQAYNQGTSGGTASLQSANVGTSAYANGSQVNTNPGNATDAAYASGAMSNANPASTMYGNVFNQAAGQGANITNAAEGYANNALSNPGSQMQQATANGSMLSANNPYFQQMAQTTLANTMPAIQSAYAGAGRDDSGLASRAASQGATDAIGGLAYSNYQQGLTQQQTAAQNIAGNYATGQQQQTSDLSLAATAANNAQSQQQTAAAGVNNVTQANQANQLTGASQLSTNYDTGVNNSLKADAIAPTVDSANMAELNNAQAYGNQLYNQNQANDTQQMAQYNYTASQPAQALQNYNSLIQGNYGNSTTSSSPYYMNSTANTLAGITGGVGLANGLAGSNGLISSLFG